MNIHELIEERVGLVVTFADDGAFHSAARVLKELSDEVEAHAAACDRFLADMISRQGAGPAPIAPMEG